MNIVLLADIHGKTQPLERMQAAFSQADVVLLAGDITDFGNAEQARQVLGCIEPFSKKVLAVSGNCDLPAVDEVLDEKGVNLHGRAISVDGWDFIGAKGALSGAGANALGRRPFAEVLEQGFAQCRRCSQRLVVVTHQPAFGTALDNVAPGRHAGNPAIRDFIDHAKPHLAVSGHIHEIVGSDHLGPTTLVSPAPAKDGHYATIFLDNSYVHIEQF